MISLNKFIWKRAKKTGLPPGTPVFIGDKKIEAPKVSIMDYDETRFQEKEVGEIDECFPFKDTSTVTWINIDGIHDVGFVQSLGENFGLHPLIIEDIVNTQQRPKTEESENYIYIVLKMLYFDDEKSETQVEQVSLVLGENFVISFQEREGDIFEAIRERIRNGKVSTASGRPIPKSEDIPGYCYVLCDITPSVEQRCKMHGLTPTSDRMGYFGYNPNYRAYIELISFDRLVNAAKERNRAFFDKLGLPAT